MPPEPAILEKLSGREIEEIKELVDRIKKEIRKAFFGHEEVVNSLIRAVFCNGHVLVEGIPGIAKTLVINSLATASGCTSKRIQFTVDLLPTDITGLTTYDPKRGFEVIKGPIFANFIVADEINRSPPKTQSALIEAMQERQVTIGKETYRVPEPFFVMASQNPLEQEGVYSLPEAQIDRFIFKIVFAYPEAKDEMRVMEENINFKKFEDIGIKPIASPKKIIEIQKSVHRIYLDERVKKYILDIVQKTRTKDFQYGEFVEMGASPRASINLFIAAKAEALVCGRNYVIPKDVDTVAVEVLRHRLILSYRAQAEKATPEKIIAEIMKVVKAP